MMISLSLPVTLFPPWNLMQWEQIDDSIRGGSSISHLVRVPDELHECDGDISCEKSSAVKFIGTLDIKTLGGAGFASQRYTFSPPLNIPSSHGVVLRLLPTVPPTKMSPTRFTLSLATSPRVYLPSGRTASRLQYEAHFESPLLTLREGVSNPSKGEEVILPFDSFEAMYRGRRVEKGDARWAPLRTHEVFDMSIMCRSGFGEQEGEFYLTLLGIKAYRNYARWWEVWKWWAVWYGWFTGLRG